MTIGSFFCKADGHFIVGHKEIVVKDHIVKEVWSLTDDNQLTLF